MPNEPQREIEQELLAYKLRRREQAGAPPELHPATRRMLQGEVARLASRPLLSSEEAAKNFVRSFVMSHQQPGFFTRHRQRLIWGGAMFASLMLVMAVLRQDPRQQEQARAFSDPLPAPPAPLVAPAAAARTPTSGAGGAPVEVDRNRRLQEAAESLSRKPGGVVREAVPAPVPLSVAAPRAASAPQVELERLASVAAPPAPALAPPSAKADSATASATGQGQNLARSENSTERKFSNDAKKSEAEAGSAGGGAVPLDKALERQAASSVAKASLKLADNEPADLSKRVQSADGGIPLSPTPPAAGPRGAVPAPAREGAARSLALANSALVQTGQNRFQQLNERAGYRQNLNSPPIPQVMQDFAFERIGDRVRIVDGDGSTYEGTVLSETVEAARKKAAADDGQEFKARATAPEQDETQAGTYRFVASGMNRKLNQSVEFRGQWQPSATPAAGAPALLAVRAETAQPENRSARKQEKAKLDNLTAPAGSATNAVDSGVSQGWISGRAVVGGKNEFDIRAVPR